jgi:aminopeptidase N
VTHADIDWQVDLEARQIRGGVTWVVDRSPDTPGAPLILDTRGLTVEGVFSGGGEPLEWEMGAVHPVLGTPLRVELGTGTREVEVRYHTGPESSGLQWLDPAQTAGREHPFLFSQAQSILARTFLPCQDSPGVRVTFDAAVTVPDGLTVVMAAEALGGGDAEPFRFRMPQPIPAYLVAIAVGDIGFRPLGDRTGVYAEPSVLDAAAYEFADTEAMMRAAEGLFGPYRWGRYDLIVLPPSFPFGGMENPRLTFVTPTVLAGDRSLVSLVAHELAHSWSGNLVTNATWADFWLNEGFTVYLERRIQEAVYGKERAEMEAVLGKQYLLAEMPDLEPGFGALHNTALAGRDPDDAFSDVPYEKGYLFLRLLEEKTGRERFDAFLRRWFDRNAFRSRTTEEFRRALERDLLAGGPETLAAVGVEEWLEGEGLPENAPAPRSEALDRAAAEGAAFLAGGKTAADLPGADWSTQEWLHMLRSLPETVPLPKLQELDAAWSLTNAENSEILAEWLLIAIRSGYEPANPALERFLTTQGRRKFLEPIYTELARTGEGRARALAIYARARPLYHAIAADTVDEILGWEG